jgi:hypothetical protein
LSSEARPSLKTIGLGFLLCAIVGSALAIGAIHRRVLVVVVIALAIAYALSARERMLANARRAALVVLAVLVGLTTVTALQCVPLPIHVLGTISPHAADVWQRAFAPFGAGPESATLSLDPIATQLEVVRCVAYVLTFLTVSSQARSSNAIQRTLIASGTIIIIVAAVHYALDLHAVYGFFRPRTDVSAISPFLNGNHLSAYGNVAFVLAYASLLSGRPLLPRALLLAVMAITGASDVFWASRGAVAAAVTGVALTTVLAFRARARTLGKIAVPALVALAGGTMMALAAFPSALSQLVDADVSKLDITKQVLTRMVPAYPVFGAGRGAFESTFPEFRGGTGFVVWTHPENIVAEWISGWGLPASIVAFVALGYALRPKHIASSRANGPWVVVVITVLHNLVDFSLEIPAVGIAIVACVALVTSGTPAGASRVDAPNRRLGTIAIAALATVAALLLARGDDLLTDRDQVRAELKASTSETDMRELLRSAIARHPAEPYFPYAGAVAASRTKGANVMMWIDRTLERAPVYPPAHLVVARSLRHRSRAQARLEYRIYAEQNGGQPVDPIELDGLVSSLDDVMEATPAGKQGIELLEAMAVRLHDRLPATAERIDAEILTRSPNAGDALLRLAQGKFADLDESWCIAPSPCLSAALQAIERAEKAVARCDAYALHARLLVAAGNPAAGIELLKSASVGTVERAACDEARARIAVQTNRPHDADEALDALAAAPCREAVCIEHLLRAADLDNERGSRNRALAELQKASEIAPENIGVSERMAAQSAQMGLHVQAARLYGDLARRDPSNKTFSAAAERESAATRQLQ